MEDYQKRVIQERDELIVKLKKLYESEHLQTDDLLKDQYKAMTCYYNVLNKRIESFENVNIDNLADELLDKVSDHTDVILDELDELQECLKSYDQKVITKITDSLIEEVETILVKLSSIVI